MRRQIVNAAENLLSAGLPHVNEVRCGKHVNLWHEKIPAVRIYAGSERNPDIPDQVGQRVSAHGTWALRVELVIDIAMVDGALDQDTEEKADAIIAEIKRRFANDPTLGGTVTNTLYVGMKLVTETNGSQDVYMPSMLFSCLVFEDLREFPADPLLEYIQVDECPINQADLEAV